MKNLRLKTLQLIIYSNALKIILYYTYIVRTYIKYLPRYYNRVLFSLWGYIIGWGVTVRVVGFGRPSTGDPTRIDLENEWRPEAVWSRRIHADLANNRIHCPK